MPVDKKHLWLDVDGVLLGYTQAFLEFSGLADEGITYHEVFSYDLTRLFPSAGACYDMMAAFSQSEAFANIKPIADRTLLEQLSNSGYTIRIITQLSAPGQPRINRIKNLQHYFGNVFDDIIFTSLGESKIDVLLDLYDAHLASTGQRIVPILVEDNPSLLEDMHNRNLRQRSQVPEIEVLGITHPYNVDTLKELYSIRRYDSLDHCIEGLLFQKVV